MAWLTLTLMVAAALGAGAALLYVARVADTLKLFERAIWAFVLGIGILGWLGFFLALTHKIFPFALILACAGCLPGLLWLVRTGDKFLFPACSPIGAALVTAITAVFFFDLLEGLAPPADADSLAYHFAIPKLFLKEGGLFFIPRAQDGAAPLLQQMTYMIALGIGGEQAMTLWTMLTGWSATGMVFVLARRHVGIDWALAGAFVFLTTPAVIYGAGSGQVEVRNAAFVILAVLAAVAARENGHLGFAALAGISAGFYAASKYPGLLFVAACALPILFQQRWLSSGIAFGAAFLVAGGQWYSWNAWNTGDPVFPLLFDILPYRDGVPWNSAQASFYKEFGRLAEHPLQVTILNLFWYPFEATIAPPPQIEARQVGFGPIPLLLLPIAAVGIWLRRSSVWRSPVAIYSGVCFVAYALWFFLGPSQRVRFHLPIYPLLLVALVVAAERAVAEIPNLRGPAAAAFVAAFSIQSVAAVLFTINYGRYFVFEEDRDAFLVRNSSRYAVVQWINGNLSMQDRVLVADRHINYLLDKPYFYFHAQVQAQIEGRPDSGDLGKFWRQLSAQGITHIVSAPRETITSGSSGLASMVGKLVDHSCVIEISRIHSRVIISRTLQGSRFESATQSIFRLDRNACSL